jgi:xylan 1,4-beta-xylosidase
MGMLAGAKPGATWVTAESSGALPLEQVVANSVRIAPDVNVVATRSAGEVDVLLWNYHDIAIPAQPAHITVVVDGLRSAGVMASDFRVDATHSNAYTAWKQMGSPAKPTADQIEKLEKAGALEQSQPDQTVQVHEGKVKLETTVPREGVVIVRLRER